MGRSTGTGRATVGAIEPWFVVKLKPQGDDERKVFLNVATSSGLDKNGMRYVLGDWGECVDRSGRPAQYRLVVFSRSKFEEAGELPTDRLARSVAKIAIGDDAASVDPRVLKNVRFVGETPASFNLLQAILEQSKRDSRRLSGLPPSWSPPQTPKAEASSQGEQPGERSGMDGSPGKLKRRQTGEPSSAENNAGSGGTSPASSPGTEARKIRSPGKQARPTLCVLVTSHEESVRAEPEPARVRTPAKEANVATEGAAPAEAPAAAPSVEPTVAGSPEEPAPEGATAAAPGRQQPAEIQEEEEAPPQEPQEEQQPEVPEPEQEEPPAVACDRQVSMWSDCDRGGVSVPLVSESVAEEDARSKRTSRSSVRWAEAVEAIVDADAADDADPDAGVDADGSADAGARGDDELAAHAADLGTGAPAGETSSVLGNFHGDRDEASVGRSQSAHSVASLPVSSISEAHDAVTAVESASHVDPEPSVVETDREDPPAAESASASASNSMESMAQPTRNSPILRHTIDVKPASRSRPNGVVKVKVYFTPGTPASGLSVVVTSHYVVVTVADPEGVQPFRYEVPLPAAVDANEADNLYSADEGILLVRLPLVEAPLSAGAEVGSPTRTGISGDDTVGGASQLNSPRSPGATSYASQRGWDQRIFGLDQDGRPTALIRLQNPFVFDLDF